MNIGTILQAAAQNLATLEAGRFVLGMGAVLVQTAGPSYVVEMACPKYRGQLTGGFQSCFFLGTIISTWLEYGLYSVNTNSSFIWRLPLAVQGLPSIIVLGCVNVLNTYVPPVAIAHSGWRFYILYVVWDAFGVVVIYFFFVETRGRSLEELDE